MDGNDQAQICEACRLVMVSNDIIACVRCGGRVSPNPFGRYCRLCRGEKYYFERAVALGSYHGRLREAVYQLKRRNQESVAFQFGRLLGQLCNESFKVETDFNCIAPLPSHRFRHWTRGMNPAAVIAEGVALETHVELIPDLLRSRRPTAKQGTLSRSGRLQNVKHSMSMNARIDLHGLRVLLVDDVMATGATVNEAARTLRTAGIKKIFVALVARGTGTS